MANSVDISLLLIIGIPQTSRVFELGYLFTFHPTECVPYSRTTSITIKWITKINSSYFFLFFQNSFSFCRKSVVVCLVFYWRMLLEQPSTMPSECHCSKAFFIPKQFWLFCIVTFDLLFKKISVVFTNDSAIDFSLTY